ncbi:traB domain-containing protein-like isoform X2 [Salvia hispanica]|uniref:traB domain-containing protein-like isoform X2 n=1 Tax=Salvia hispanica TaxID=49212 RepID=UPI00200975EB|nr:traB domain-containing protein-like isoform X2 [Salvia hispanica]XP_047973422.1 traB domain-containing protein-like isoform X2 [Salvia hispanica]
MYRAKRLYQITTPCQQRLSHSSAASRVGYERKRKKWMPQELTRGVVELTCKSSAPSGVCNVYLVGTNHSCLESGSLAQAAVKFFKPEVVFLELCSFRKFMITGQPKKVPTIREMVDMWRKNMTASFILFEWYVRKCDESWDGIYNGEFYLANEEAIKYGAKVILGDRPYPVTMMRYIGKTSLTHLMVPREISLPEDYRNKIHGKIHAGTIDRFNEEYAKQDPTRAQTFMDERDQYMSTKLLEVAVQHESVVAIVGMGHVPGITKYWNQKHPIDVEQLLSIPKQPITVGILGFIGGILVIILKAININIKSRAAP